MNKRLKEKRAIRNDISGHIAFYTLFLIPVVVTFSVLAFDVAGWQALREEAQSTADRVAIHATQLLPDIDNARSVVEEAIQREPVFRLQDIVITDSSVSVTLSAKYRAAFDKFLSLLQGGADECRVFCVSRSSSAQVVPTDYVIIMADGRSQRPAIGELAWGNEVNWPASDFWDCSGYLPTELIEGDANQSYDWTDQQLTRWATQSCFNPVLSNLKLATISLVDSLSAVRTNRLAFILTPGSDTGDKVSYLRNIRGEFGGFVSSAASGLRARWINYIEPALGLGSESCALFSYPQWEDVYVLPSSSSVLVDGCELLIFPQCDYGQDALGRLTQCYAHQQLTLREAIYWNPAKLETPEFDAEPDILAAIWRAIGELLPSAAEDIEEDVEARGSLGFKARRQIIVVSDRLPAINDPRLSDIVSNMKTLEVELTIVGMSHEFLSSDEAEELLERITALEELAAEVNGEDVSRKLFRVFYASSPEEFNEFVLPKLVVVGRELALST